LKPQPAEVVQVVLQLPRSQALPLPHWVSLVHAAQTLSVQIGVGFLQVPQVSSASHPSLIVPQVLFCAVQVVGVQPQTPSVPSPPQVWGAVQVPHEPLQPSGPQALPVQSGMQTHAWSWHSACPVQTAQVMPPRPQAVFVSPSWQTPSPSQQFVHAAHCPSLPQVVQSGHEDDVQAQVPLARQT
jgi:hypothetical protein